MSGWLIVMVAVIYAIAAIDLWSQDKVGLAIAFSGYAFSNIGLFFAARA